MLSTERVRLLREDPWTAQGLAEELYAMFTDESPLDVGDGVVAKYNSKSQQVPFQIINAPDTGPIPVMAGHRAGGGSFVMTINNGGIQITDTTSSGEPTVTDVGSGGGSSSPRTNSIMPGKIVGGSSDTYTVMIYPRGRTNAGTNVVVKQLQISVLDTIPAELWVWVVLELDGSYSMIVPTFV